MDTLGGSILPAAIALGVSAFANNKGGSGSKSGKISVEDVRLARDMWISAVQRLSVSETVSLYDTENVRLLGTVDTEDNKLRNNHKLITEYFNHFLAHDKIVAHFPVLPSCNCSLKSSASASIEGHRKPEKEHSERVSKRRQNGLVPGG